MWDSFNAFDNFNFFVNRVKPFVTVGRSQTEAEARELDDRIWSLLTYNNHPFSVVDGNKYGAQDAADILKSWILIQRTKAEVAQEGLIW